MLRVGGSKKTSVNRVLAPVASFVLPLADLGSGQVDTKEYANGAAPTFTRATTAWTKLSTGLWAPVASGTPRSFYTGFNTNVGTYAGYLSEGARTNELLQSRTGTATNWIKTSVTAAQDQAGIDGVANSGFSLTGTGASGTCKQAIASTFTAGISRTVSCFMKRVSGAGDILLSVDGGVTNVTVTPNINTTAYVQVTAIQTVATATFAITIVTSGDKIAVDMGQEEQGGFASTPITTTVAAVTRNNDVLTYATTGWFNPLTGTLYAKGQTEDSAAGANNMFSLNDGTANNNIRIGEAPAPFCVVVSGGVIQANITSGAAVAPNVSVGIAASYGANDFAVCSRGLAPGTDAAGSIPTVTQASIGSRDGTSQFLFGPITTISYYPVRLSNSVLQQLST